MSASRLLLIPSFTELEWGIRPALEEWAEVATFDMPGMGEEPVPAGLDVETAPASEFLSRWREAAAERGLTEADRRGWDRFVLVTDGYGTPAAVRLSRMRPESVLGLVIGHASLSHDSEGDRAPMSRGVWDAMTQLAKQGNEAFVRYGIAQMTRGGVSEEVAQQMLERFPNPELISATVDALGQESEPIGDDLATLDVPLLLAKHEGCLGHTDEGFEDIAAAFPEAETVICPETCASSPTFAQAIREFSDRVASSTR